MRDRAVEAAALAMEALWVYALALVLTTAAGQGRAPSVLVALAAALGGFWLVRLFQHLDVAPGTLRAAWTAVSLLALLALLRLDYAGDARLWDPGWLTALLTDLQPTLRSHADLLLGAATAGGLWVRSAGRAAVPLDYESVARSFSVGFAAMLAALLLAAAVEPAPPVDRLVFPFFLLGLAGMALSQERRLDLSGEDAPARRPWVAALGVTMAALLALALLATLAPRMGLRGLLLPAADAALWTVNLLLLGVAYVVLWLVRQVLLVLIGLFGTGEGFEVPEQPSQGPLEGLEEGAAGDSLLAEMLVYALQAAAVLAVGAAVVLALAWAFRRLFRGVERDQVREAVAGEGSLGEDLRALWRGLADRFRRAGEDGEPGLPPGARRVRALYLRMLRQAAEEGVERPPGRTPEEFAPVLAEHYGSETPGAVTAAFVRARYGRYEPDAAEVEDLEGRWLRIRDRR